jgi:hypothetical protein
MVGVRSVLSAEASRPDAVVVAAAVVVVAVAALRAVADVYMAMRWT